MILYAYALLDTKSGVFSPPFFMIHDSLAVRAAIEVGSDKGTTPGRYPEDFVLYGVGAFDDNAGVFTGAAGPRNLGVLSALLAQTQRSE